MIIRISHQTGSGLVVTYVQQVRNLTRNDTMEEQKDNKEGAVVGIVQSSYTGPIPPPEVIKGYESIIPGSAERLLKMAEMEQQHRFEIDNQLTKGYLSLNVRGQLLGFCIVIVLIIAIVYLTIYGHEYVAGGLTIVAVSLAVIFVLRKVPKNIALKREENS